MGKAKKKTIDNVNQRGLIKSSKKLTTSEHTEIIMDMKRMFRSGSLKEGQGKDYFRNRTEEVLRRDRKIRLNKLLKPLTGQPKVSQFPKLNNTRITPSTTSIRKKTKVNSMIKMWRRKNSSIRFTKTTSPEYAYKVSDYISKSIVTFSGRKLSNKEANQLRSVVTFVD